MNIKYIVIGKCYTNNNLTFPFVKIKESPDNRVKQYQRSDWFTSDDYILYQNLESKN